MKFLYRIALSLLFFTLTCSAAQKEASDTSVTILNKSGEAIVINRVEVKDSSGSIIDANIILSRPLSIVGQSNKPREIFRIKRAGLKSKEYFINVVMTSTKERDKELHFPIILKRKLGLGSTIKVFPVQSRKGANVIPTVFLWSREDSDVEISQTEKETGFGKGRGIEYNFKSVPAEKRKFGIGG